MKARILVYFLSQIKVNCTWKEWSDWSTCNTTCGGGWQLRARDQKPEQHGGEPCLGPDSERQMCNTEECPSAFILICVFVIILAAVKDQRCVTSYVPDVKTILNQHRIHVFNNIMKSKYILPKGISCR